MKIVCCILLIYIGTACCRAVSLLHKHSREISQELLPMYFTCSHMQGAIWNCMNLMSHLLETVKNQNPEELPQHSGFGQPGTNYISICESGISKIPASTVVIWTCCHSMAWSASTVIPIKSRPNHGEDSGYETTAFWCNCFSCHCCRCCYPQGTAAAADSFKAKSVSLVADTNKGFLGEDRHRGIHILIHLVRAIKSFSHFWDVFPRVCVSTTIFFSLAIFRFCTIVGVMEKHTLSKPFVTANNCLTYRLLSFFFLLSTCRLFYTSAIQDIEVCLVSIFNTNTSCYTQNMLGAHRSRRTSWVKEAAALCIFISASNLCYYVCVHFRT